MCLLLRFLSYVCHIDSTSLSSLSTTSLSPQTVFATPLDRRLPRIRLRTRQAPLLLSQKILVSIDRWDIHSRYPEGHFVRALGAVESKGAEQESLLLEYEVPYRPFGKGILDCLPKEGETWVVPPKDNDPRGDWRDRTDLRDMVICSIDPVGEFRSSLSSSSTQNNADVYLLFFDSHRLPGYRRCSSRSTSAERKHRSWSP